MHAFHECPYGVLMLLYCLPDVHILSKSTFSLHEPSLCACSGPLCEVLYIDNEGMGVLCLNALPLSGSQVMPYCYTLHHNKCKSLSFSNLVYNPFIRVATKIFEDFNAFRIALPFKERSFLDNASSSKDSYLAAQDL